MTLKETCAPAHRRAWPLISGLRPRKLLCAGLLLASFLVALTDRPWLLGWRRQPRDVPWMPLYALGLADVEAYLRYSLRRATKVTVQLENFEGAALAPVSTSSRAAIDRLSDAVRVISEASGRITTFEGAHVAVEGEVSLEFDVTIPLQGRTSGQSQLCFYWLAPPIVMVDGAFFEELRAIADPSGRWSIDDNAGGSR